MGTIACGDRAAALDVANKLCAAVRRDPVLAGETLPLNITISAGVAILPTDASEEATLLSRADRALYSAKVGGRNRAMAFGQP